MKYTSKSDFLGQVRGEYASFRDLVDSVPPSRRREAGVWGDDWTVSDLLSHLAEWHRLFLGWFRDAEVGLTPRLPAPGYKWNETPRLNRDIWAKHRGQSFSAAALACDSTHGEVYELLESLPEPELLEAGHFSWTAQNPLVTYAGANTASHYRFAKKVLKRWLLRT